MIHEPLRGKKQIRNRGCFFDEDDVKSAVEFYKKYRDMEIIQLMHSGLYMKFISQSELGNFDSWLFDYCFGDVIS